MTNKLEKAVFSKEIRKELKPLIKKNNYRNVIALSFDWFVIFSSILISVTFKNFLIYLVAIILIGSRMRAFDNLMHEACHRSLFTNKFWNKWIACLFVAFPVFTSYTAYCNSHFKHHRNLWDEENDPDTKRYRLVGLDKPQKSTKMFVKNHIVKVLLLFHVPKYIVGTISANLYTKEIPKSEIWVRNIFWITIITLSVIFNFWLYLILYWLVPILTTFQIVHHLFPAIPHYNLKKAHEILMKDEAYRNAHHCTGFFKTTLPGFYSVVKDICTPNYERKES